MILMILFEIRKKGCQKRKGFVVNNLDTKRDLNFSLKILAFGPVLYSLTFKLKFLSQKPTKYF